MSLTLPETSNSLWGVSTMFLLGVLQVATLVLLSIKISASYGFDPGRKYWPETLLG